MSIYNFMSVIDACMWFHFMNAECFFKTEYNAQYIDGEFTTT